MTLIILALFILCTAYSDVVVNYVSDHMDNNPNVCEAIYRIQKLKAVEVKKKIIKPKEKNYFLKKHGKKYGN